MFFIHCNLILWLIILQGNSSPESHGKYVWKHFISEWPGKVAIVAHSAGGYVTVEMVSNEYHVIGVANSTVRQLFFMIDEFGLIIQITTKKFGIVWKPYISGVI